MSPRKGRAKSAPAVVVPRKRRRRRTRKEIDLATAKGAIETILAAEEPEVNYDHIINRVRTLQSDIKARISIVGERYARDGDELNKLHSLSIADGTIGASVMTESSRRY